jgi:hypothetical protein
MTGSTAKKVDFSKTTETAADRFAEDIVTGAVIDRYSQQSVAPEIAQARADESTAKSKKEEKTTYAKLQNPYTAKAK